MISEDKKFNTCTYTVMKGRKRRRRIRIAYYSQYAMGVNDKSKFFNHNIT